jgi:soluble lytic murein transglycosylase-like protein
MGSQNLVKLLVAVATIFLPLAPVFGDVFAFKDANGVMTFTNVPNHAGYRRVLKENAGQTYLGSAISNSYEDLIRSIAGRHNLDTDLVRAVIRAESDFDSTARSNKGAMGLMQLMPDTARLHHVIDAFNPSDNVEGGVRHLKMLLERYQGNLELSLAAYNAGSGAVEKHGGIPPFAETREYVRRVLRFYDSYRGNGLTSIQRLRQ